MKKLFILLTMLIVGIGSSWAALSSTTITKSGNVTDTWNIKSALPTDNWVALANPPSGLPSGTPFYRTQELTISDEGALSITFVYKKGDHRLDILGVDLLNSNDEVVRSDYHAGYTGGNLSHNSYLLDHVASGTYKIRFIINNAGTINSEGTITIKHLNIKTANSFAEITHWYFMRMHSNYNDKNMYYDGSSANGIAFGSSQYNNAYYLWGFVKDTDGIRIYNKAAGSSVAIDNANPCTLSASGTSLAFTIDTGNAGSNGASADAYFSLYMNANSKSYLNYRSNNTIQRWEGNDQGSTFMIYEQTFDAPFVEASEGKIYTIKANYPNNVVKYFSNNGNGKDLDFNNTAANGVNDYWILRSSGNGLYPWKFESGRGDGNYLSNNSTTEGLTNTGVFLQINTYIMSNNTYFELRGSNSGDASTQSIVNLGTWSGANGNKGFGKYGVACWTGTGHWMDANWTSEYNIEEVTGVSIYKVVSNINAGGVTKTVYTGKAEQTNGGFYILSSTPAASDFNAISVDDYTAGGIVVDASAKTITVNYTANITYTLTDVNGAEYTWSASGTFGTSPTITGCYGLTVSNEEWNEEDRTYTADIAFPFPISSNNVTNWRYINIFDAKSGYTIANGHWFYLHASGDKVIAHDKDEPTNESGKIDEYKWAIIPSISYGNITFTIKNAVANKFIYHDGTETYSGHTGIKLGDTGVELTYKKDASANKYYWYIPSVEKYISANSVNGGTDQRVGALAAVHDGESVGFYDLADFATLMANLKTARTSFTNYFLHWNLGEYTETVEGTMTTTYNQTINDRNVVKDNPTAYFTASQFKSYTDNYNNAVEGLNYVMPTGKFIRIKHADDSKYVKDSYIIYDQLYALDMSTGGTGDESIFYLNESNKLISYHSGCYVFATIHSCSMYYKNWVNEYEFLKGSAAGKICVHAKTEPTGWNVPRYWAINSAGTNLERVETASEADDFVIESVTSVPVTFNSSALGYATFNSPVALKVPTDVKAYVCKIEGSTITLHNANKFLDGDNWILPANTPVLLYNKEYETNATKNFEVTSTTESYENLNDFKYTVDAATPNNTDYTYYALRKKSGAMGFYQRANQAAVLPGFRAWIMDPITTSAREFTIVFDGEDNPTGIAEALGLENDNVEIYDLNGRKLSSYKHGINIVNGKKVFK